MYEYGIYKGLSWVSITTLRPEIVYFVDTGVYFPHVPYVTNEAISLPADVFIMCVF